MTDQPTIEQIRGNLSLHMAELLQVPADQLDPADTFLQQGADSIVLVEAIRRINAAYGVQLSMQQFFEQLSSIDALSAYLLEHASAVPAQNPHPPKNNVASFVPSAPSGGDAPTASTSQLPLMQAQLQLVKHTIEQQNRLIAATQPTTTDTTGSHPQNASAHG